MYFGGVLFGKMTYSAHPHSLCVPKAKLKQPQRLAMENRGSWPVARMYIEHAGEPAARMDFLVSVAPCARLAWISEPSSRETSIPSRTSASQVRAVCPQAHLERVPAAAPSPPPPQVATTAAVLADRPSVQTTTGVANGVGIRAPTVGRCERQRGKRSRPTRTPQDYEAAVPPRPSASAPTKATAAVRWRRRR